MERNRTEWREKEEALTQNSSGSSRTSPVSSRLSLLSFSLSTNAPSPPRQSQRLKRKIFFSERSQRACAGTRPTPSCPSPCPLLQFRTENGERFQWPVSKKANYHPETTCRRFKDSFSAHIWDHEHNSMNNVSFKGVLNNYNHMMDGKGIPSTLSWLKQVDWFTVKHTWNRN